MCAEHTTETRGGLVIVRLGRDSSTAEIEAFVRESSLLYGSTDDAFSLRCNEEDLRSSPIAVLGSCVRKGVTESVVYLETGGHSIQIRLISREGPLQFTSAAPQTPSRYWKKGTIIPCKKVQLPESG